MGGPGSFVGENRAPLPSPAPPAPPSPAGKESSYVLLGEDRPSKAKARRGSLTSTSSWGRTAGAKRRRRGGGLKPLGIRLPPPSCRRTARAKRKARRGSLRWREPRPPSVTGSAGATFPRREGEFLCPPGGGPSERSEGEEGEPPVEGAAPPMRRHVAYAKGSAGAGASSARDESLGVVEVSADRDLGLEPVGFLSM